MKTTKKMSKKLLAVGLLGLVLALGVTLVGCGEKCNGFGDCSGTYEDNGLGVGRFIEEHDCTTSGCIINTKGFGETEPIGTTVKCDC